MPPRALIRLAGAIAVSSLVASHTMPLSARPVILSNDVDVTWSNQGLTCPRACPIVVLGGPRLLEESERAQFVVTIDASSFPNSFFTINLKLGIQDASFNQVLYFAGSPLRLGFENEVDRTLPITVGPGEKVTLNLQQNTNPNELGKLPSGPLVFTVSGTIAGNGVASSSTLPTIILSGGRQVAADRLGDADNIAPRDAIDLPTRALELVRALSRLESSSPPRRLLDLDASAPNGSDPAVGFTHAFDFPLGADGKPSVEISGGTLKIHLKSGHLLSDADVVLLDEGVDNVAGTGRTPDSIPMILLGEVVDRSAPQSDLPRDFSVELAHAPVSVLTPHGLQPSKVRDLTKQLRDGRLNVIVLGSAVDYSDLTVRLNDPQLP